MPIILKKLTSKTAGLSFKENVRRLEVVGRAMRCESGETDKGAYTVFKGQFAGQVVDAAGVIHEYASANLILPAVAADILLPALVTAQEKDKNAILRFGIAIEMRPDPTAVLGYAWAAENLIEPDQDTDPLADLKRQAKFTLAAPKTADAPALPAPKGKGKGKAKDKRK